MRKYKILNTDFTMHEIELTDDATVEDMKRTFAESIPGLEPEDFSFSFKGRMMEDSTKLRRFIINTEKDHFEVIANKKEDPFAKFGL